VGQNNRSNIKTIHHFTTNRTRLKQSSSICLIECVNVYSSQTTRTIFCISRHEYVHSFTENIYSSIVMHWFDLWFTWYMGNMHTLNCTLLQPVILVALVCNIDYCTSVTSIMWSLNIVDSEYTFKWAQIHTCIIFATDSRQNVSILECFTEYITLMKEMFRKSDER
jgi:hypothetical protein